MIPLIAAMAVGALLWSDDFTGAQGSKPDAAKWSYDLGGGGWGNGELEKYTDETANVFLDGDGHLVIRAIRGASGEITSARLKTKGKFVFQYGRAEARMKIPHGQGFWPAFWMLGDDIDRVHWPECGEVDVMENVGKEPGVVHGTIHGPGYSGSHGISAQYALPDGAALSDDFHLYAADWEPESISFSIDGKQYARVSRASLPSGSKWVYDHPFFLILNLAVGGHWPGMPDGSSRFPQDLLVDYVRVYGAETKDSR